MVLISLARLRHTRTTSSVRWGFFCLFTLFLVSGCDPGVQNSSQGNNSSSSAVTSNDPALVNQTNVTPQPPSQPNEFKTTIKSNVFGATVVIQKASSGDEEPEEFLRSQFEKQNQFAEVQLPPNQKYTIMLQLAELIAVEADYQPQQNGEVEINFTNDQFSDLHRAAACLLVIPGGGFGSGFLMGDRQTVATAAHCVACENVNELEIVFHPTEPRETRQRGAKLIYFDAKQDVALRCCI